MTWRELVLSGVRHRGGAMSAYARVALCSCLVLCAGLLPTGPAQAQGVKPLQAQIGAFAKANKLRPLALPVRGLALGSILDANDQVLRTGCWTVTKVELEGLNTTNLEGVQERESGLNLSLKILGLFGISIGAGSEQLDSVRIEMGELTLSDGADAAFNWTDGNCLTALRQGKIRVLERLLQTASINAEVITTANSHISVDSAHLGKGKVDITLQAGIGKPKEKGFALVTGDSLAIARGVHQWELNTLSCAGANLVLKVGEAMKAPSGCPDWYRARIVSVSGQVVVLAVQASSAPGATVRQITTDLGTEFALDKLAQRVDLGTLQRADANYALNITRLEVRRKPRVLGSYAPLSRAEAVRSVRLADRVNESE